MPISIQWLIEGKIIYSVFAGTPLEADFAEWSQTITQMLVDSEFPVYCLTDLGGLASASDARERPNLMKLRKSFTVLSSPKISWNVTYGKFTDPLTSFLGTGLAQLIGYRVKMLGTVDDAVSFIQEFEPDLDLSEALHYLKSQQEE